MHASRMWHPQAFALSGNTESRASVRSCLHCLSTANLFSSVCIYMPTVHCNIGCEWNTYVELKIFNAAVNVPMNKELSMQADSIEYGELDSSMPSEGPRVRWTSATVHRSLHHCACQMLAGQMCVPVSSGEHTGLQPRPTMQENCKVRLCMVQLCMPFNGFNANNAFA